MYNSMMETAAAFTCHSDTNDKGPSSSSMPPLPIESTTLEKQNQEQEMMMLPQDKQAIIPAVASTTSTCNSTASRGSSNNDDDDDDFKPDKKLLSLLTDMDCNNTSVSPQEAPLVWDVPPRKRGVSLPCGFSCLWNFQWCTTWFCPPVVHDYDFICVHDYDITTPMSFTGSAPTEHSTSVESLLTLQQMQEYGRQYERPPRLVVQDDPYKQDKTKTNDIGNDIVITPPTSNVYQRRQQPQQERVMRQLTIETSLDKFPPQAKTPLSSSSILARPKTISYRSKSAPVGQPVGKPPLVIRNKKISSPHGAQQHQEATTPSPTHPQQLLQHSHIFRPYPTESIPSTTTSNYFGSASSATQSHSIASVQSDASSCTSRHRRNSAAPLSPQSLSNILLHQDQPAGQATTPSEEQANRLLLEQDSCISGIGSVTFGLVAGTLVQPDDDELSPLDSEDEDDFHGRHPHDTPRITTAQRKSIDSREQEFASRNRAFFSDDDDDDLVMTTLTRSMKSHLAFERRRKSRSKDDSTSGSHSSSSFQSPIIIKTSSTQDTEVDPKFYDLPKTAQAIYLAKCPLYEQELLKTKSDSCSVCVSGWVAYSKDDSVLRKVESCTLTRDDLAYMIVLNQQATLYFFQSTTKEPNPTFPNNKNTACVLETIDLSCFPQYATSVESPLINQQHGHAITVVDKVTRSTHCALVPVSLGPHYFVDQNQQSILVCDELLGHVRQPHVTSPFSPVKGKKRHAKQQTPWKESLWMSHDYAPVAQHEAVMHVRFALDSLIRTSQRQGPI